MGVWITVLVFIGSMVLAGRMAHARRRSIKAWVWVAAIVGPIGPLFAGNFPDEASNA
jgi:hypothetical protein